MRYNMKITVISKTKNKTEYNDVTITSFDQIDDIITDTQSILVNRTDLKDFLYSLNSETYKEDFQNIKRYLRSNYQVHKLYFNPRTFEFFPRNKCFLIHQR